MFLNLITLLMSYHQNDFFNNSPVPGGLKPISSTRTFMSKSIVAPPFHKWSNGNLSNFIQVILVYVYELAERFNFEFQFICVKRKNIYAKS